jgi:hypothetical protein
MIDVKEHVNNDQIVRFNYYRDGSLWYETQKGFMFPVPVTDIGNATFKAEDRAILFMRYIRKHAKAIEDESNSTGS